MHVDKSRYLDVYIPLFRDLVHRKLSTGRFRVCGKFRLLFMICTTMVVAPVTNMDCSECIDEFAALLLSHRRTHAQ